MDAALNSFLERFGEPDTSDPSQLAKRPTQKSAYDNNMTSRGLIPSESPLQTSKPSTELKAPDVMSGQELNQDSKSGLGSAIEGAGGAAGIASGAMGMADDAVGLWGNISGDNFDTSAKGGGVGSGAGAALQGGMQGMKMGMQVGGPWGAAIGAAVGAGGTLISHGEARKEYMKNVKETNLNEDAFSRQERENEYRVSEGLASIKNLKGLREKQLGLT